MTNGPEAKPTTRRVKKGKALTSNVIAQQEAISVASNDEIKKVPLLGTHFRLTIERDEALVFIPLFIQKWQHLVKYLFTYEEKGDNHHIHGHLEWDKYSKQTMSDWMKLMKKSGKYYNDDLQKTAKENLLYITKDLDVLATNYSDEEVDAIIKATMAINEDKAMDMRHKLFNLVKDNMSIQTVKDLKKFIYLHYVNVLDKEPPFTHLRGYMAYIALKMDRLREEYMEAEFGKDILIIK